MNTTRVERCSLCGKLIKERWGVYFTVLGNLSPDHLHTPATDSRYTYMFSDDGGKTWWTIAVDLTAADILKIENVPTVGNAQRRFVVELPTDSDDADLV